MNTGAKREYGLVSIPNGGPQVPDTALAEGWVKLRDDAGRKEGSEESAELLQRLEEIERKARSEVKGLWKENGLSSPDVAYELPDPQGFVGEWKGREVNGIFFFISLALVILFSDTIR